MRTRRFVGGLAALSLSGVMATAIPDAGAKPVSGWLTPEAPMLTLAPGLPSGASLTPIISSGEELGSFLFEGLPDGIGLRPGAGRHTVDVYVNHEQSTVPFQNARDVVDSSVSQLTLNTKGGTQQGAVLDASVAVGPELGFLRFCSAFMGGPDEGLDDYVFFTGEETNDIVDVPAAAAPYYGADPALSPQRQGGYQVVYNTDSGELAVVEGLGRLNHENTVVVPGGWDGLAMYTTDDTFSAPSSQLYLYLAQDQDALFADEGHLYAFRVTAKNGVGVDPGDPFNGANDYLDVGVDDEVSGEFIPVPDDVARGTTGVAPQQALEDWSNANNVFQAIRLEDLAYDLNDPHVLYIADTGATRVVEDPATGRLIRAASGSGFADNGRIFKLVLNEDDPTIVDSLTVLADGDAVGHAKYVPFTSPDNVGVSKHSLMVQEDTASAQVFQYRIRQGTWRSVATVNDPTGEASGIVDASAWFGGGTWLLTVQAHGSYVFQEGTNPVVKREAGQLLLMKVPGS